MVEQTITAGPTTGTLPTLTPAKESETDKLRAEMMVMMKGFAEQQQSLMEVNASLQAQLKLATLAAQSAQFRPQELISVLPEGVEVDDEVTYINHAGRPEHGKIIEVNQATGTVLIEIHGAHENDVQLIPDVKFGDKKIRGTFTLAPPPAKPKVSLPKAHPKGLQTPGA